MNTWDAERVLPPARIPRQSHSRTPHAESESQQEEVQDFTYLEPPKGNHHRHFVRRDTVDGARRVALQGNWSAMLLGSDVHASARILCAVRAGADISGHCAHDLMSTSCGICAFGSLQRA